jgi:hypothetical protein
MVRLTLAERDELVGRGYITLHHDGTISDLPSMLRPIMRDFLAPGEYLVNTTTRGVIGPIKVVDELKDIYRAFLDAMVRLEGYMNNR